MVKGKQMSGGGDVGGGVGMSVVVVVVEEIESERTASPEGYL
jgi:hypothetical protein